MSSNSRSLVKNTSIYALGDIIPKLLTFVIFPIYTKHISPEQYGIIDYINTIDTFVSLICVLSINTYFLVAYYKVDGEDAKKKLLGNLSTFIFIITLFVTGILLLCGPALFRSWGSNVDFYPYIALGLLINITNIVTFLPTCLYRVQERPLPLTILNILKSVFVLIGSVLAVTIFKGTAFDVLFIRLIISGIFAIIFVFSVKNYTIFCFNLSQVKDALKFALPLVPGSIAYYLFNLFDRVLIDKYLSLSALAIFSTASSLAMILNVISNGAYKAFEPYFFKTYGTERFDVNFKKVRDVLLVIVCIGAFSIGLFSKEFFELFTSPQYYSAYRYVPIILIGTVVYSVSLMYDTILIARGCTIICTLITIMGAIVNIVLNVLFLQNFGIYCAAIVKSVSFILVFMARCYYSKVKVNHIKPILFVALTFTIIVFISYFWPTCNIGLSIFLKTFIMIVYAIISINAMGVKHSISEIIKK